MPRRCVPRHIEQFDNLYQRTIALHKKPKYSFEFLSNYDGVSDYRLYIDGKPDTRFRVEVATRRCFYQDNSRALGAEVKAFNEWKRAEHAKAKAKYPELVEEFQEYKA